MTHEMMVQEAFTLIEEIINTAHQKIENQRNAEIVVAYANGASLEEAVVGTDLTRERGRQIINKSPWSAPEIKSARKIIDEYESKLEWEEKRRKVIAWSHENSGRPIAEAVDKFRISQTEISKMLGDRKSLHPANIRKSKENRTRWSDEEILSLIRKCKEETGKISAQAFQDWSVPRGGPTKQTPTIRFGTWANAVKAAGVEGTYAVQRKRAFNDDDMYAALVEFCSEPRASYAVHEYEEWSSNLRTVPSAALLRNRLRKSWPELIEVALKIANKNYSEFDPKWIAAITAPRDWLRLRSDAKTEIEPGKLIRLALQDVGEYLTAASFDIWAKERDFPTSARLMVHAGKGWSELVTAEGGCVGSRGRRGYISEEEAFSGLRKYASEHEPSEIKFEKYNKWAQENNYLSAGYVARRAGSWLRAVQIVTAENAE